MNPFFLGALLGLIAGILLWLLPFPNGREEDGGAEALAEADRLRAELEEQKRELKAARQQGSQQDRRILDLEKASEEKERLARRVQDLESLEARLPGIEAEAKKAADLRAEIAEMKARSEQAHWQFEAAKSEQNRLRDALDRALAESQAAQAASHHGREALERRIRELEAEASLAAASRPAPASIPVDALEQINGIGLLMKGRLNGAGLHTFRDLAALPREALQELLGPDGDADAIQAEAARRAGGESR